MITALSNLLPNILGSPAASVEVALTIAPHAAREDWRERVKAVHNMSGQS